MRSKLSKLGWYWHRLWAMSPREVLLRLEKKTHQIADARYAPPESFQTGQAGLFPILPEKRLAPPELRAALARDVERILRGEWKAFGHLPVTVCDPPLWQADNLVGENLRSSTFAFKLDHRAQPAGADIKVLWEPSRWYQLVRLAMAGWLLDHSKAQDKCVEWLHHWVTHNPPFTGLNWTSGLETGLRLVQYTWIDAFLSAAGAPRKTLEELRKRILPAHLWYTWRYKSFGSSANNHLIGELAGLILAVARWPDLARLSAPLSEIASLMEREIMVQFADDGGNSEQALGYHLFSWEFCFQARRALEVAGHPFSSTAVERLARAGQFYRSAKTEDDPWDFGDSDNAWVTPLFAEEENSAREWWRWFNNPASSPALLYWWGDSNPRPGAKQGEWQIFPQSGYATLSGGGWFLRFDFSPLGYLSMAPHGHLDALHLSVAFKDQPAIIDPGTGAYYANKALRNYLAGWSAHNSPHPATPPATFPRRFGTFLWGEHHKLPTYRSDSPSSITAQIDLPYGRAIRTVAYLPEQNAIKISDRFIQKGAVGPVLTRWKFAPQFAVDRTGPSEYRVGPIRLQTAAGWQTARTFNPPEQLRGRVAPGVEPFASLPIESLVSPAFRAVSTASYLVLESKDPGPLELLVFPG